MQNQVEKVSVFITLQNPDGPFLLLFNHPYAGVQIPAGTLEDGETPEQAALREGLEESGLSGLQVRSYLGSQDKDLGEAHRVTMAKAPVYSRPDLGSFQWVMIRKGIQVAVERKEAGFTQVTYLEHNRLLDPQFVTFQVTGWAPDAVLARIVRRHFIHLDYHGDYRPLWTVRTDNHVFEPFWAPLSNLPSIVAPQDKWLAFLNHKA